MILEHSNVPSKSALFSVHGSYSCFSGAFILLNNKKGFVWVVFAAVTSAPRHAILHKEHRFYQIISFFKKGEEKKIEEIFLSIQRNFVQQNRLVDIAPEHFFGVTLTEF